LIVVGGAVVGESVELDGAGVGLADGAGKTVGAGETVEFDWDGAGEIDGAGDTVGAGDFVWFPGLVVGDDGDTDGAGDTVGAVVSV
jgi:hypothetical protein